MTTPTVITFVAYLILLLGIGFYFYRRNESIEEYLLGGRRMGPGSPPSRPRPAI